MILSVLLLVFKYKMPPRMSTREASSILAPKKENMEEVLRFVRSSVEVVRNHVMHDKLGNKNRHR